MVVDHPDQLAALTSPVRLEVLELFGIWGPCGVRDIAQHMDRTPDSLYYHVRKLVQVKLLVQVERRRTSHRFEAIYRLCATELEVPRRADTARGRRSTTKAIDAILRLSGRELRAALDDQEALAEGPLRTFYGGRLKARLSKTAVRELNRHLKAIERVFAEAAHKPGKGPPLALTIVMNPVRTREAT